MSHRKQKLLLQEGQVMDRLKTMWDIVLERKDHHDEKSYTGYLFESGLDKILKKVAEETGETIIAAKNDDNSALCGEVCDLIYHLFVMMAQKGLSLEEVLEETQARNEKMGNLKQFKQVDRLS